MASAVQEKNPVTFGPPTGFFITAKMVDRVPLLTQSTLHERLRAMLLAAQADLFQPLVALVNPVDFPATYELLSFKYFPVRLQALLLIVSNVGLDNFCAEYFHRAPQIAASLATHATKWGLGQEEVATSFQQYFDSAIKLIGVAPNLRSAEPPQLVRLATSIIQIDYGFTAMGLVFEGSIQAQPWCVSEVFRSTRRALFDYGDAVEHVVTQLRGIDPNQAEMFSNPSSRKAPMRRAKTLAIRSAEPTLNKKAHERYSDFEHNYPF